MDGDTMKNITDNQFKEIRSKDSRFRTPDQNGGFTLIEVMIAMVVLLIGMLGVLGMQYFSIGGNATSREIRIATHLSQEMIEQLKGTPYPNLTLVSPGTDNPMPPSGDPFTDAATSGNVVYTRAWWAVTNCTDLGPTAATCVGANTPACATVPDAATASPIIAIRARTCWNDANNVPHSVAIDSTRWDERI